MCTRSEDFLGMCPSQKKKKERQVFGSSKSGIPDIKKKKIMGCLVDLKSAVVSNCTLSLAFFFNVYIISFLATENITQQHRGGLGMSTEPGWVQSGVVSFLQTCQLGYPEASCSRDATC